MSAEAAVARTWPDYRTVWRWHFYAGLFCIPFVLWLATTGAIYLFKPQIEAWLDRPYDHLAIEGARASPQAIAAAALAAVPGSVLNAYELPPSPSAAVRVLVGHDAQMTRVYVHPQTRAILHTVDEDARLMNLLQHLHGELLLGDRGSMLVELAASWAIVMLLSGLFLWWPRTGSGLAGIIYPRLGGDRRRFWRDLHAVTGFWVSLFALFLLFSGLPWAKSWGGLLKEVRGLGQVTWVRQDWTSGRSSELAARIEANSEAPVDEHAAHHRRHAGAAAMTFDLDALDRLVPVVQALALAAPVLIAPPSQANAGWSARSDAQNRPLRTNLSLDATTATVTRRVDFDQRPLLDRAIGIGVAAHEGQLFGWLNQALGLFAALGLILVSLSALVMWWRRRRPGELGAPRALPRARYAAALLALVIVIAVLLPLFGLSLLCVFVLERVLLRRIAGARRFLGLQPAQG
ncbi:MAG: PepSY domain-containing protein [Dokdonella sp.]